MAWKIRENLFTPPIRLDQGTTPTITVELGEDILVSDLTDIWFYIYDDCDNIMLDKNIEDMVIDAVNNAVIVPLSQEDTLALSVGDGKLEMRLLDDEDVAYKSEAIKVDIIGTGKGGVIGGEEEVTVTPSFEEEGE